MEGLISVLLPVFNAAETLPACLESILAQREVPFEVVAVNDGSTDDSAAILNAAAAADPRLRVFHPGCHRGIVEVLNRGLDECRGVWVARMDADDRMFPERLVVQRRFFEDHPQTDLLGSRIALIRDDGPLTPGQEAYRDWSNGLLTDAAIRAEIFAESPIMHPTFFLSRAFYHRMQGYCSHPWAEDYDFLLRAFLEGACFAKTPEVLVVKRDWPQRLYRLDPRCKRKALVQAKAHYFARFRGNDSKAGLVIIGSGHTGRMVGQALQRERIPVVGFVDNAEGGPQRTIGGIPVFRFDFEHPAIFFRRFAAHVFGVCIGIAEVRLQIENILQSHGLRPGRDYFRFI
jgi:glycosyltransferase involved in cell wall biosynthesis